MPILKKGLLLLSLLIPFFYTTAWSIETTPPLSDREIIDKLARLEEGQRHLSQEMNQRFKALETSIDQRFKALETSIDQRFKALETSIDQRFETIDQRFEALETSIDQRFEAVNQRFESLEATIDRRFAFLEALMMILIAGVFGLIGFVIWDRKTALRPSTLQSFSLL